MLVILTLWQFYGRRSIYITSFSFFLVWLIPCAVAQNIETMIVCRFLNGLAGSAFLSVAGGTVGDLFNRHELSAPMMLYTSAPFMGPEVGPLYVSGRVPVKVC
jgi:MFS family permease